jgi:hypothetical protein
VAKEKDLNKTLNKDFSSLNEKNKKSVLEMTKFLVLSQNNIIPSMLNETPPADAPLPKNEGEKQA